MTKGKCFSMVDQGQRRKADDYPTHYGLTRLFLVEESFQECESIWEPCIGEGAMRKEIMDYFPNKTLFFTDIKREGQLLRPDGKVTSHYPIDFLVCPYRADAIITNPPYSLFHEIILKAKRVADKKIAMLLPLSYLQGQKRYDELWQDKSFALSKVYVFNRFPDMTAPLREDGKFPTGMMAMAWYVWNKEYTGAPKLRWLDCRKYVLSKKDKVDE